MGTYRQEVAIIDYGLGNLHSVAKALAHLGADPVLVPRPEDLDRYGRAILPGVGAFGAGMDRLERTGLAAAIRAHAAADKPLLGICLGMQVLFEVGQEGGRRPGLALLPGEVGPMVAPGLKVPHVGWNTVRLTQASPLTAALADGGHFYFVHSFAAHAAAAADLLGETTYGEPFAAIVRRGSVAGAQFHPEKSGRAGLTLLGNFLAWDGRCP